MKYQLKPLASQVIVITGATSGIGLTTARMAAARGATLVLAARNSEALGSLASELQGGAGGVATVTADVGKIEDVARIGEAAIAQFGAWRRPHQPGQRGIGPGGADAGHVFGVQARGQGLHRSAAGGTGE